MATGGTAGQVLTKNSATNYDTGWTTPSGARVTIGATAPASPTVGDFWWRNDPDGVLYVYYNDGTSSQWVPSVAKAPPAGPAAGDLTGTYPAPTVAKLNGAPLGTTTPLARGDLLVANGTPALARLALGAASTVLQSNGTDVVWGTSLGGPPSGAAGGDLQGTYPNPTIIPSHLPWTVSGATLTPTDATKIVAVSGDATSGTLLLGNQTAKGRVQVSNTGAAAGGVGLFSNRNWLSGNAQDDGTKPSWGLFLRPDTDQCAIQRSPVGSTTQTTLLTLDNAGTLATGTYTPRVRLQGYPTAAGYTILSNNAANTTGGPWVQDDNTKVSWVLLTGYGGDNFQVCRIPAGGTTLGALLTLDNAGNLTITGATATKAAGGSGTAWATTSDRRIKAEIRDYAPGLSAIVQLLPRAFVYNGKGGSTVGRRGWGFIADELAPVFPEAVDTYRGTLDPDDDAETDIQRVDVSNVLLALVNAVKELAARVAALEAR